MMSCTLLVAGSMLTWSGLAAAQRKPITVERRKAELEAQKVQLEVEKLTRALSGIERSTAELEVEKVRLDVEKLKRDGKLEHDKVKLRGCETRQGVVLVVATMVDDYPRHLGRCSYYRR
jgi:hypothetical protein